MQHMLWELRIKSITWSIFLFGIRHIVSAVSGAAAYVRRRRILGRGWRTRLPAQQLYWTLRNVTVTVIPNQ